jgi:hypothetical protein
MVCAISSVVQFVNAMFKFLYSQSQSLWVWLLSDAFMFFSSLVLVAFLLLSIL